MPPREATRAPIVGSAHVPSQSAARGRRVHGICHFPKALPVTADALGLAVQIRLVGLQLV